MVQRLRKPVGYGEDHGWVVAVAEVAVLTHNGFCADGRARPWWQLPIHRQLLVRTALVTADRVPSSNRLAPWLERTWTQVDAGVAAHAD